MPENATLLSNGSVARSGLYCLVYEPNPWVFTIFTLANALLLLPLCVLVLYHGVQRWRQHCSPAKAATATHSDHFTYHLVIMEMLNVLGTFVCCYGIYAADVAMLSVFFYLFCVPWYGEMLFHVLACVEHYLAVVHPITYQGLRENRWSRIRNVGIACIWVLCLGLTSLVALQINTFPIDFSLLIASVIIISFCNFSALCSLVRPGPLDRDRVDQSKQKAFYMIEAILGVLLLRCLWNLLWMVPFVLHTQVDPCLWLIPQLFVNLPGSLMLPFLFLNRAGALACCRNSVK